MTIHEIEELWDQRPFVPFEMTTADGSVHRVEHEKWMLITPDRRTVHYVNASHRSRFVAVDQITSVSPVERRGGASRPRKGTKGK